jgi:hypothetical protein
MKKNLKVALLVALLSMSSGYCSAQEQNLQNVPVPSQIIAENTAPAVPATNPEVSVSNQITPQPPALVAPVVADTKRILKPANRKVDLHAIVFDPAVTVKEPANAEEMTKTELAKYDIDHALHGEVSTPSTKGLLEDTMKMTFEKGPIESIAPWIDYNGAWTGAWTGEKYTNSTYGVNFNDVGINGKFRTNDDPASGKKTVFRLMYNVGKEITGNTYLQSFMADNYIMRYWTKDDQVLVGYARAAVGIEGGESPFTIPFFGRSQISRTYGNVRTLGVKAQGNHKLYDYSLGFFSSGRYFKDFFPGPEFVGLVSIKPLGMTNGKYGKLTMGGSLNAGNAESHYVVGGAHLIYEYKRLKATVEYASADGSNGSTGFTNKQSEGYYGTLAYRITPRIQAVIRYDQFDPNKNKANDIRTEYTAGLNYFVKGQALKLMLNYVYYTVENGTYGSRIMAGTQIVL